MQRILISGGAGFIASHTADLLLEHGYAVRVMDHLEGAVHQGAWKEWPPYVPPEVERLIGDVRNDVLWETALEDVDAVIHLAAYQDGLPHYQRFFEVNVAGTAALYEVIRRQKLPIEKIVVASSQAVYGEGEYTCPCTAWRWQPLPRSEETLRSLEWEIKCDKCGAWMEPYPIREYEQNSPTSVYGLSKLQQEQTALFLGKQIGVPTVALRYSIVQGARQSPANAYSGILRVTTQRLLNGLPPLVYEDGGQLRDYVAVQDVARANLLALEELDHGVYNVGGDRQVSVLDLVDLVASELRPFKPHLPVPETPIQFGGYRVGDCRHLLSDISKIKAHGWRPRVPMRKIVRDYVRWAKEQTAFTDRSEAALKEMRELGVVR